jgi:hypothetical protein
MANLLSIPAELLDEILSYLSLSSLLGVCGTCKRLQSHAEPFIYRSVRFRFAARYPKSGNRGLRSADEGRRGRGCLPIHFFFRTICHRPELAAHVKVARFVVEDSSYWHKLIPLPPPPDMLPAWREGYREAQLSCGLETVVQGHASTLTAVLLSKLHHLAELEVDYGLLLEGGACVVHVLLRPRMSSDTDTACTTSTSTSPFCYPKLKRVLVTNDLDSGILRVENGSRTDQGIGEEMLGLLCLPTLEEADLVIDGNPGRIPWEFRHSLPTTTTRMSSSTGNLNLRRLGLLYCCFASPSTFDHILAVTPRLETLELFFAQDLECLRLDPGHQLACRDEWRAFATALRHHVRDSLKRLVISVDFTDIQDYPEEGWDFEWIRGIWQRRGDLGSLHDFPALERLEVPMFVLLGWLPDRWDQRWAPDQGWAQGLADVLPRSLKELCLREDLEDEPDVDDPWYQLRRDATYLPDGSQRVFNAIADYVAPLIRARELEEEGERPLALERICLKVKKNCIWPLPCLMRLKEMSQAAGISCTFRMRMSGMKDRWNWTDEVMEVIIFDRTCSSPNAEHHPGVYLGFPCRYFKEPSRQFRNRRF